DVDVEIAPAHARFDTWHRAARCTEHAAHDGRDLEGYRIAAGKFPPDERGPGIAHFVVVAQFEMKRATIQRCHADAEVGLVAHRVVVAGGSHRDGRPGRRCVFGCTSNRRHGQEARNQCDGRTDDPDHHPPSAFTATMTSAPTTLIAMPV